MKKLSLFILFADCLLAPIAYSASFNCSKAHSKIEKMICADKELSAMDSELLPIYQQARKATNNSKAFRNNGKKTLRWRNKNCKNKACLVKWYKDRRAELLQITQSNSTDRNTDSCVTDGKEITLTGVLRKGTFAGPPNFESVANGDTLMTYHYLETDKPMCAFIDTSLEGTSLEKIEPQQHFQLFITKHFDIAKKSLNNKIKITAIPYTGHTIYHYTPLVLEIKQLTKTN